MDLNLSGKIKGKTVHIQVQRQKPTKLKPTPIESQRQPSNLPSLKSSRLEKPFHTKPHT